MQNTSGQTEKHICAALLAHVDAGKTTLSESLLYTAGSIRKLGKVDTKDAFLDTNALERARGITIFSKQARFTWKDTRVTLLDTPGHVDFSAEMERVPGGFGLRGFTDQRVGWRSGAYTDAVGAADAV